MGRRRRKGFIETVVSFVIFSLALFGGWTFYKQHKEELHEIADKTKKAVGEAIETAKEVVEDPEELLAVSHTWTCWFSPTKKAAQKCEDKRNCYGVRAYGQHYNKEKALELGNKRCSEEFGECRLDYCEGG